MKRPQTNFHVDTMSECKDLGQKSQNFSLGQNLLCGQNFLRLSFFSYRHFIKATTTDVDMLLKI